MDGVQGQVTLSFPILHKEYTPDGDLLIWGKATDGTVDSDKQIVDTDWSGKALQEWLATGGNVRVQHSPHLYPAGKGIEVEVAQGGAHWVRSLIVEKTAKELVEKGVLTAYSVGIAQPQIVRSYDAPGGKIVGGIIAELSLVDRPANKNCGFQLCKSAGDGHPEFVGKMFGDTDLIEKVGPKGYEHGWIHVGASKVGEVPGHLSEGKKVVLRKQPDHGELSSHLGSMSEGAKISFGGPHNQDTVVHRRGGKYEVSHKDQLTHMSGKPSRAATHALQPYSPARKNPIEAAREYLNSPGRAKPNPNIIGHGYDRKRPGSAKSEDDGMPFSPMDMANLVNKRDFSQDERDSAASSGAAMPDGSFPIHNGSDLSNAIHLAGQASNPAAAKSHIKRRASALGLSDQIPDTWKGVDAMIAKGAKDCPECGTGHDADSNLRSCRNCGSKLPKGNKSADADLEEREDADIEKGKMPPQFAAHAKKPGGDAEDAADGGDDEAEEDDKPAFLQGKSAQPTDGVRAKTSEGLPRHREPDGGQTAELERDAGLGTEGEGPSDGLPNGIWTDGRPSNTPDTMKSASYATARLHDALCAAFHVDDVMGEYPAMKGLIGAMNDAWADLDGTARQIVKGLGEAASMDGVTTDTMILDEARVGLSKSFGDMYPNVRITPGSITAGQFTRPYLTAGHPNLSAQSPGHMPGPSDASFGSTETMRNASQFNRANMRPHSGGGNNSIPGSRPAGQRLAAAAKQQAANAMQVLHDRLASEHPYLCPMSPGSPDQLRAVSKAQTDAETSELRSLVEKQAGELSELRSMIDRLESAPDPGAAPHRGIVAKSASGGTEPADRRSLAEEAMSAEKRERQKFYSQFASSGDASLREAARAALDG